MALVPLKTKVERTSSCLMGKQRYSSLSLSQRLYVRCLLASQEALIDSLLCIVSLYHAGVLGAGRQADWVLLHLLIDFFF